MIKSMTAYAGTDASRDDLTVAVEIRGYNSRNLDVALKLYHRYGVLEDPIRKAIAGRITRGRVEIKVTITEPMENAEVFHLNEPMARAYFDTLSRLKTLCGLTDAVSLNLMAAKPGVIETADPEVDADRLWAAVSPCLENALDAFDAMRQTEGAALATDLEQRLAFIDGCIGQIAEKSRDLASLYQEKLKTRITALTQGLVEIDPARIAQEAAFIADRGDISEELVRARSHLAQFRSLAGRALNFLIQEFNREFNTMGSKAGDAEVAHIIVSSKTELEKIREQVQNIE